MPILMPTLIHQHFSWQLTLEVAAVAVPIVLLRLYTRRVTGRTGSWLAGCYATLTFRIDKVAAAPQDIVQWMEQDGLLYLHKQGYQVMPRRAFSDSGEIDDLRRFLVDAGVTRVGPRGAKIKPRRSADPGEVF